MSPDRSQVLKGAFIVVLAVSFILVLPYLTPNTPDPDRKLRHLEVLVTVENSNVNGTTGIGYLKGVITIYGSIITQEYYNSTETINSSANLSWDTISVFNKVNLGVEVLNLNLTLLAFHQSSITLSSLQTNCWLAIILHGDASLYINGFNSSLSCQFYGSSSGTIINCSAVSVVNCGGSSSVEIINSTIADVYAHETSRVVIQNSTVSTLSRSIYINEGVLEVGDVLNGSYINTTTISNSTIGLIDPSIFALNSANIILKNRSELIRLYLYDNSTLTADYSHSPQTLITCRDNSSFQVTSSEIAHIQTGGKSQGRVLHSNISSITASETSSIHINQSSVSTLMYGIYYSSGNLSIIDGVLPAGFHNCSTIINSTVVGILLGYVSFMGNVTATITGTIPYWWIEVRELADISLEGSVMPLGWVSFSQNSVGLINNSDINYLFAMESSMLIMRNSTVNTVEVSSIVHILDIIDGSEVSQLDTVYYLR